MTPPHRRSTASDRDLAEAVRRTGDESAFRELYRRHTSRLLPVVARLLGGSRHDAEDAVQETWIRAVRGLDGFRWDAAFGTWLCGIGIRVGRDGLRRRLRGREDLWDESFDPPLPEVPLGDRIDLERGIALLPDGYRVVLVLYDIEGFRHEDIAERLEISVGTSKSQLHRARRMLRTLLAPATEQNHA
jgi:RNA polymerase sigma-70 factor (ECF subfamily)